MDHLAPSARNARFFQQSLIRLTLQRPKLVVCSSQILSQAVAAQNEPK